MNCRSLIAAIAFVTVCGDHAAAQTTWTGGIGDWFQPVNWSSGIPNASSPTSFDAQINNGGIAQIFSVGASVRRITLGTLGGQGGAMLIDAGTLNVTENLRLGESGGMGNITIRNGGDVSANATILGVFSGSGLMTVSGEGSTFASQTLTLGELASGTLVIREGADVTCVLASLANSAGAASGSMTVTGAGSTFTSASTTWIGRTGVGNFMIEAGGNVSASTFIVAENAVGDGTVTITGAGSRLTNNSGIVVASAGIGRMTISNGGRVDSGVGMIIGNLGGGVGTVTVTGANSILANAAQINVGQGGAGTLNLVDSGRVTVAGGTGPIFIGSTVNGDQSTVRIGTGGAPGTLEAGSISLFRANSKLEFNHTGDLAFGAIPINGAGSVRKLGDGTTTLSAISTYSGGTNIDGGTLRVTNANGAGLGTGALNINPSSTVPSRVVNFAENANAGSIAVNVFPVSPGLTYGGSVTFTETASAGTGQFTLFGATSSLVLDQAAVFFSNSSTAGAATFTNSGGIASAGRGGEIDFTGNASAGSALFTNSGGAVPGASGAFVVFAEPGTSAGSAHFINLGTSTTDSRGVRNGGTLFFLQGNASSAQITNAAATGGNGSSGLTTFNGNATGGSAAISNVGATGNGFPGGATNFRGTATAGGATITNAAGIADNSLGGSTTFFQNATAGTATITNFGGSISGGAAGTTTFAETSNAGTATFINQAATAGGFAAGGRLSFEDNSSAQSARITNRGTVVAQGFFGGITLFSGNATAGSSTIVNEGGSFLNIAAGQTVFNSGSAGAATITANGGLAANAPGGSVTFLAGSASSATLTALPGTNGGIGGFIEFQGGGSGGDARLIAEGDGAVSIAGISASGTTAGSIAGSGGFFLGAKRLTVGSNNTSTVVSGSISGSTGGLTKVGTSTLTLSGTNSYTGGTSVDDGRLQVNSALPGEATVTNGSLAGTGPFSGTVRVGTLFGPGQAFLDPGTNVGVMTVTNTLNFAAFGAYRWEFDSNIAQGDRIVAAAAVNLNFGGSGRLIALDSGTSALPPGLTFTILDKQSIGPVSGAFAGLPEGAEFDLGANRFRISYVGGNGNDVTLTNTSIPESSALPLALAGGATLLLRRDGTQCSARNSTKSA